MTVQAKILALALAATAFASAVDARPLTPAEQRDSAYSGRLPACDDPAVLSRIQSRFSERETTYWKSGLEISGYDRVREIGWRSPGKTLSRPSRRPTPGSACRRSRPRRLSSTGRSMCRPYNAKVAVSRGTCRMRSTSSSMAADICRAWSNRSR